MWVSEPSSSKNCPALRKFDVPVIANVFGYCQEDYPEVIRILEDADGLAAYELNISCPNVKKGGVQFGERPRNGGGGGPGSP